MKKHKKESKNIIRITNELYLRKFDDSVIIAESIRNLYDIERYVLMQTHEIKPLIKVLQELIA